MPKHTQTLGKKCLIVYDVLVTDWCLKKKKKTLTVFYTTEEYTQRKWTEDSRLKTLSDIK